MPTILYCLLRWRKTASEFTFIEILCIYGYSLSIYVPISILWLINVSFLQWVFVIVAILLSGSVLVFTFWPPFNTDSNRKVFIFFLLNHFATIEPSEAPPFFGKFIIIW